VHTVHTLTHKTLTKCCFFTPFHFGNEK